MNRVIQSLSLSEEHRTALSILQVEFKNKKKKSFINYTCLRVWKFWDIKLPEIVV